MASFFSMPKGSVASGSGSRSSSIPKDNAERVVNSDAKEEVNKPSEFERTFKPFSLKKDAELASYNWLSEVRHGRIGSSDTDDKMVIVVDDEDRQAGTRASSSRAQQNEDVVMRDISCPSNEPNRDQMTAEGTVSYASA